MAVRLICQRKKAYVDLVGPWQHMASGHRGYDDCFYLLAETGGGCVMKDARGICSPSAQSHCSPSLQRRQLSSDEAIQPHTCAG
eukprot:1160443-Pelagomonas_calceolata.AAC.1